MRPAIIPFMLLLTLSMGGCAHAQAPACKPSDKNGECVREGRTEASKAQESKAQESKAERRRAVPAVIPQGLALPPPPATVQRPQAAAPVTLPPVAPPPAAVTSCDPGGCWDSGGTRYNNANGNVYMNNSGRTCHQIGNTMQCF